MSKHYESAIIDELRNAEDNGFKFIVSVPVCLDCGCIVEPMDYSEDNPKMYRYPKCKQIYVDGSKCQ